MHPVTAQTIAARQIRDLHVDAAAERWARQAGRSRRVGLAVRLRRAGHGSRPATAPRPAHDPGAA
jgi:hypothetical protein